MAELGFEAARVALGAKVVVDGVSLTVRPGVLTVLIGPNGAGKTTLLRAGIGLVPTQSGAVRLNGADPRAMAPPARARLIAYLPQSRPLAWPIRVRDMVALGRFAHGAAPQRLGEADRRAIDAALAACDLEALAERSMETLSGGEASRAHLARALSAEAPLILADEPTAALDPAHALRALEILRGFCRSGGGALITLHDLSLAARFADRIAVMAGGRLLAEGPTRETLTPALLAEAFAVRARVEEEGESGLGVRILAAM